MDELFVKYPKTAALEGSGGTHKGLGQVPYKHLLGRFIVVEEKMDGTGIGLSFPTKNEGIAQTRGHFIDRTNPGRQFSLLYPWVESIHSFLLNTLGDRYICFGEWMAAKHAVFYDQLPHFFLEFDVFDRMEEKFLSTAKRKQLLKGLPIVSVPVLYEGLAPVSVGRMFDLIQPSVAKSTEWMKNLNRQAAWQGVDPARIQQETDMSALGEGLYIKVEEGDYVMERYKLVRADFVQGIRNRSLHWKKQVFFPNLIQEGYNIFDPSQALEWTTPYPQGA